MDVGHSDLNTAVPLDEDLNDDLVILRNSLDDSTGEECQQQRTQGSSEMNKKPTGLHCATATTKRVIWE